MSIFNGKRKSSKIPSTGPDQSSHTQEEDGWNSPVKSFDLQIELERREEKLGEPIKDVVENENYSKPERSVVIFPDRSDNCHGIIFKEAKEENINMILKVGVETIITDKYPY